MMRMRPKHKDFHSVMKKRRRTNSIISITIQGGSEIEDGNGVKGEVNRVFEKRIQ